MDRNMLLSRHIVVSFLVKSLLVVSVLLQSMPIVLAKPMSDHNENDMYVTINDVPTWNKNKINWCLRNRWIKNSNPNDVKVVLNKALGIWSAESILTFEETNCQEADIRFSFER